MVTISKRSYPYNNSFDNTIKSSSFLYTSIRKAMKAVVACKPHTAHVSSKTPKKLRLKRVLYYLTVSAELIMAKIKRNHQRTGNMSP